MRAGRWGDLTRLEEICLQSGAGPEAMPGSESADGNEGGPTAVAETATYTPPPNRRVGQYELLRRIGRGGGGEVYEARHSRLNRRVAIKVLSAKNAGDEHSRLRFLREMESIGQLHHPHIVQAYDAGDVNGVLYLAMELINGPDVETLARRVTTLSIADACEIVRQSALGVQHAHENRLVHRDLKPSNLLISQSGVKVADLGMALLKEGDAEDENLTDSCVIMGTGDYLAPEQTEGAHYVDIRADLYSLGCTLYRLLAGRPPFAAFGSGSVMQKLMAHVNKPVPDIASFRPDVPDALKSILSKLLAKNRDDRFSEPRDLADALVPLCHGSNLPLLLNVYREKRDEPGAQNTPITPGTPVSPQSLPSPTESTILVSSTRPSVRTISFATLGFGLILASGLWIWNGGGFAARGQQQRGADSNHPERVVGNGAVGLTPERPVNPDTSNEIPMGTSFLVANTASNVPVAPPLGPIAQLWKKEFGQLPIDLKWPGQSDFGISKLDEELGSVVIQAKDTVRFVKLGEVTSEDQEIELAVDVIHSGAIGGFGMFFGFKADPGISSRFCQFQAIHVQLLASDAEGHHAYVRRFHGKVDGRSGSIGSVDNSAMKLRVPFGRETLRLEVRFKRDHPPVFFFCNQPCAELCDEEQNQHFANGAEAGPFGLYANNAMVLFTNPQLRRKP